MTYSIFAFLAVPIFFMIYDYFTFPKFMKRYIKETEDLFQGTAAKHLKRRIKFASEINEAAAFNEEQLKDKLWEAVKCYNETEDDIFIISAMAAANTLYKMSLKE